MSCPRSIQRTRVTPLAHEADAEGTRLTWIKAGTEFGRNEKLGVAKHWETKPKWHNKFQETKQRHAQRCKQAAYLFSPSLFPSPSLYSLARALSLSMHACKQETRRVLLQALTSNQGNQEHLRASTRKLADCGTFTGAIYLRWPQHNIFPSLGLHASRYRIRVSGQGLPPPAPAPPFQSMGVTLPAQYSSHLWV
jgi:hypothetical protein